MTHRHDRLKEIMDEQIRATAVRVTLQALVAAWDQGDVRAEIKSYVVAYIAGIITVDQLGALATNARARAPARRWSTYRCTVTATGLTSSELAAGPSWA